jgi:L-iditol 2-dehydrogenase
MDAAVLEGPSDLNLRAVEPPLPGAEDCLIAVRAVGICGTDLRMFDGRIPLEYPRVLGHEIVGEVASGPASGPPVGTRVIVDPSVACGRCDRCREGRENLCPNGWLIGRDRDGGLTGFVVAPSTNVHRVPEGLDDDTATLIQVLTTCVHGQRMVPIGPGDSVAVVGLGVTGLLHVQLAKGAGARSIVGTTRSPAKLERASGLGADAVVPATGAEAIDRIVEITGGGADVVIECAGTLATLGDAVRIARYGGRILAYGTIPAVEGPFPFYELYKKELVVTSPRAAVGSDFPAAIDVVNAGMVRLDGLVSHRVPLPDVATAFATAASPGALKVVVDL